MGRKYCLAQAAEIACLLASHHKERLSSGAYRHFPNDVCDFPDTAAKSAKERDGRSLVASLIEASEANDPSEVEDLIHDAVVQLFKDAKARFERTNARGVKYSLAEDAYDRVYSLVRHALGMIRGCGIQRW